MDFLKQMLKQRYFYSTIDKDAMTHVNFAIKPFVVDSVSLQYICVQREGTVDGSERPKIFLNSKRPYA